MISDYSKTYAKQSYNFFKAHGICTRCNKEKAIEGHTMCADCLANEAVRESKHTPMTEATKERRKAKYEYRKVNGLCLDCGKPRHKDSGSYCYEHMLYHRRKKREGRQGGGRILTGCPRCGKPSKPGFKLCEHHYELAAKALEIGRAHSKNTQFMQGNEEYWKMRQKFAITNERGTMKLYYDNVEQAKQSWPDCNILSIEDDIAHVGYIDNIIAKSIKTLYDVRGRTVCQLTFPWGWGLFRFTKSGDNWLNLCEYQLHNNNDKVEAALWVLGQPKDVWSDIINIHPTFIELQAVCKSKGGKLTKPKELKGINSIGSAKYSKASCAVFIAGNDIYIRHNDYFSPIWTPPDPEYRLAPLDVKLNHYFGKEKSKKFIYTDCWGSIVLQNVAWLKFENYVSLFQCMKASDVALLMRNAVFEHNGFDTRKGGYQDWLIFMEDVCNLIDKELSK